MSSSLNVLLRYATDCTFSSRKMKKFLGTVGGGNPPPTLSPRSVAKLPRKDCAPKCFGSLRHCSMH